MLASRLLAVALFCLAGACRRLRRRRTTCPSRTRRPSAERRRGAAGRRSAAEPPPPIYEDKLLRLSEILGALSFLRDLCGEADGAGLAGRDERRCLPPSSPDRHAPEPADRPLQPRLRDLQRRLPHLHAVRRACDRAAIWPKGRRSPSDVRSRYSQ